MTYSLDLLIALSFVELVISELTESEPEQKQEACTCRRPVDESLFLHFD